MGNERVFKKSSVLIIEFEQKHPSMKITKIENKHMYQPVAILNSTI
jgi:hypothetical protein